MSTPGLPPFPGERSGVVFLTASEYDTLMDEIRAMRGQLRQVLDLLQPPGGDAGRSVAVGQRPPPVKPQHGALVEPEAQVVDSWE